MTVEAATMVAYKFICVPCVRPTGGRSARPCRHRSSLRRRLFPASLHRTEIILAIDHRVALDLNQSASRVPGIRSDASASGAVKACRTMALNPGVLEVVRHAAPDQKLGRERLLFNARAAIERYHASEGVDGRKSVAGA